MEREAAGNHLSWFGRGRERVQLEGVALFLGEMTAVLGFPAPDADLAGAVRLARESGASEISCWALAPDEPLGERLHALGFQDGWQPHWLGIDASEPLPASPHEVEETTECEPGLPYWSPYHQSVLGGDVHHLVVREDAEIVGHAVLNVDGESGGIYDMGVAWSARRRGIGLALTLAAVARASDAGCTTVTLNATGEGEPMYRRAGFRSFGLGMTWFLFT